MQLRQGCIDSCCACNVTNSFSHTSTAELLIKCSTAFVSNPHDVPQAPVQIGGGGSPDAYVQGLPVNNLQPPPVYYPHGVHGVKPWQQVRRAASLPNCCAALSEEVRRPRGCRLRCKRCQVGAVHDSPNGCQQQRPHISAPTATHFSTNGNLVYSRRCFGALKETAGCRDMPCRRVKVRRRLCPSSSSTTTTAGAACAAAAASCASSWRWSRCFWWRALRLGSAWGSGSRRTTPSSRSPCCLTAPPASPLLTAQTTASRGYAHRWRRTRRRAQLTQIACPAVASLRWIPKMSHAKLSIQLFHTLLSSDAAGMVGAKLISCLPRLQSCTSTAHYHSAGSLQASR